MKKVWKLVEYAFVITSFPIAYLAGYVMVSDIVFFWQHGIEKHAIVKSLERTRAGTRSITFHYDYRFEIDGREFSRSFPIEFPVGESVTVLVSPTDSGDFILGSSDDYLFELFSLYLGGYVAAILVIVTYLFIIYATPWYIKRLIWHKGKLYDE